MPVQVGANRKLAIVLLKRCYMFYEKSVTPLLHVLRKTGLKQGNRGA